MKKERFKLIPIVYLIVKNENKVLLSLRKNTGNADGYYSLVAGHVDGNETARQACAREAMEEAGMGIDIEKLKLGCTMHRLMPDSEYIDMFFIIEDYYGNLKNMEPHKCGGLEYFDLDNLPSNLIPDIKRVIENVLNGVNYCECGFGK